MATPNTTHNIQPVTEQLNQITANNRYLWNSSSKMDC